jgi:hypothetical protein
MDNNDEITSIQMTAEYRFMLPHKQLGRLSGYIT